VIDERFIDLDELVLLCRSEQAKRYIDEAVSCYRAGAFRSCIVATWIAVVFDFVEKLRLLELAGDANAKKRYEQFEKFRVAQDVRSSLQFEKEVPEMARREFELVSDHECVDLKRILEDRHRCAHPSMNTADEVYSPTAELARAHLRNAVVHLLRHPPVQGKAALDRVVHQIQSAFFPTEIDDAVMQLRGGAMAHPRESLVRNLTIVILKTIFHGGLDDDGFRRHCAALNAVRRLHPGICEPILCDWTNRLTRELSDTQKAEVVRFLSSVPGTWDICDADIQATMERVVESLPEPALQMCMSLALDMPCLSASATKRLEITTPEELCVLVQSGPRNEYMSRALDFYRGSDDDGVANYRGAQLIVPLARFLSEPEIVQLFDIVDGNEFVRGSSVLASVVRAIRDAGKVAGETLDELIRSRGLEGLLNPRLVGPEEERDIDDIYPDADPDH
jgi:hypothetical protein